MTILFFLKPLWDNADILGEDAYKKVKAWGDLKREAYEEKLKKRVDVRELLDANFNDEEMILLLLLTEE